MAAKTKAKGEAIPETSISRRDSALLLMNDVNKSFKGKAVIHHGDEVNQTSLTKRLSTGLLTLDVALAGGFPAAAVSQIAGPKNSGKSWMYWQVIRQLQRHLGDKASVLLAMTEMKADKSQGRKAGVAVAYSETDISLMNAARQYSGMPPLSPETIQDMRKQIGTIDELYSESAESMFDCILRAVEVNAYHLIVIDSIGSLISGAEAEADSLLQKTYGGAASVISQFLRKLCLLLNTKTEDGKERDTCILCINQVRDAIGDPHKEFRSPGGKALDHAKFVDLFVNSGAKRGDEGVPVNTVDGVKKQWVQTGKEINWKIEKGKVGIHEGAKGSYIYLFDENTADFEMDYMVAGLRYNVIQAAGAWLSLMDEQGNVILKACGKDAFAEALSEDHYEKYKNGNPDTLMEYIRKRVYKAADINIRYDWDY